MHPPPCVRGGAGSTAPRHDTDMTGVRLLGGLVNAKAVVLGPQPGSNPGRAGRGRKSRTARRSAPSADNPSARAFAKTRGASDNPAHASPAFERGPDAALEAEAVDRRRARQGADAIEAD